MLGLSRRSLINCSIGLAAVGALGRPFIADAQAKPAVDKAFKHIDEIFAKYEIKA